jgi:hypothetical protein
MKNLHPEFNHEDSNVRTKLNKDNLLKYLIMIVVVSVATLVIPTCGVLRSQAIMVGLLAGTTFAIIDMCFPNNIYINEFHSKF